MISKLPVNEWLVLILACFAVTWIKSFDQRQPGQERVYFTKYLQAIFYHWRKSEWELTAGSWRQALWTDVVCCLTLWATSYLVLIQLRSSDPGMVMVITMGWTLPCQSPFKQFLPTVPTTLPELRFLFSKDKLTIIATHSSPFSLGQQWYSILW